MDEVLVILMKTLSRMQNAECKIRNSECEKTVGDDAFDVPSTKKNGVIKECVKQIKNKPAFHEFVLNLKCSFLILNSFFVALVTHSDIRVVAAEHNLAALCYDFAAFVYSGVDARLFTAGAYSFNFRYRVRYLEQSH